MRFRFGVGIALLLLLSVFALAATDTATNPKTATAAAPSSKTATTSTSTAAITSSSLPTLYNLNKYPFDFSPPEDCTGRQVAEKAIQCAAKGKLITSSGGLTLDVRTGHEFMQILNGKDTVFNVYDYDGTTKSQTYTFSSQGAGYNAIFLDGNVLRVYASEDEIDSAVAILLALFDETATPSFGKECTIEASSDSKALAFKNCFEAVPKDLPPELGIQEGIPHGASTDAEIRTILEGLEVKESFDVQKLGDDFYDKYMQYVPAETGKPPATAGKPSTQATFTEFGDCESIALKNYPVKTKSIGSGYGWRINPIRHTQQWHRGIDLNAGLGSPVYAAYDGKIIAAVVGNKYNDGFGIYVGILHGTCSYKGKKQYLITQYNHLSGIAAGISEGVPVAAGQQIGQVGSTGDSTGPHLDFKIYPADSPTMSSAVSGGKDINPAKLLANSPLPSDNTAIASAQNKKGKTVAAPATELSFATDQPASSATAPKTIKCQNGKSVDPMKGYYLKVYQSADPKRPEQLFLYNDGKIVKTPFSFPVKVSTAKKPGARQGMHDNEKTPVGDFCLENKYLTPNWAPAHKIPVKYVFPIDKYSSRGIWVHGTPTDEVSMLGTRASLGGVRIPNDVFEWMGENVLKKDIPITIYDDSVAPPKDYQTLKQEGAGTAQQPTGETKPTEGTTEPAKPPVVRDGSKASTAVNKGETGILAVTPAGEDDTCTFDPAKAFTKGEAAQMGDNICIWFSLSEQHAKQFQDVAFAGISGLAGEYFTVRSTIPKDKTTIYPENYNKVVYIGKPLEDAGTQGKYSGYYAAKVPIYRVGDESPQGMLLRMYLGVDAEKFKKEVEFTITAPSKAPGIGRDRVGELEVGVIQGYEKPAQPTAPVPDKPAGVQTTNLPEKTSLGGPKSICPKYDALFTKYIKKHNAEDILNVGIVGGVAYTESGCRESPSNGQGMMQVVRCASRGCSLEQNIDEGIGELVQNYRNIQNKGITNTRDIWTLIFFGYNRGMATVARAVVLNKQGKQLKEAMAQACFEFYDRGAYNGCSGFNKKACCDSPGLGAQYPDRIFKNIAS